MTVISLTSQSIRLFKKYVDSSWWWTESSKGLHNLWGQMLIWSCNMVDEEVTCFINAAKDSIMHWLVPHVLCFNSTSLDKSKGNFSVYLFCVNFDFMAWVFRLMNLCSWSKLQKTSVPSCLRLTSILTLPKTSNLAGFISNEVRTKSDFSGSDSFD